DVVQTAKTIKIHHHLRLVISRSVFPSHHWSLKKPEKPNW
ncbi:deCa-heme c-type cytochrome domain protein, partial [Vibrio parahaemolyticus V-223/04]